MPVSEFAPGVVALVTPDGAVRQVADGLAFPNGMAVTPDNATLIVAESYGKQLTAFDIDDDGGLSNRRVWADLGDGSRRHLPGCRGRRLVRRRPQPALRAGPRGRRGAADVELDRGAFACALGGPDRTTLFIMATEWKGPARMFDGPPSRQVLTVEAPAPGVGYP